MKTEIIIKIKERKVIEKMGDIGFKPIIDPVMNIASFHLEGPKRIVEGMAKEGFNISRTVNPPGLRFVIMPHVSKTSIDEMIKVLGE